MSDYSSQNIQTKSVGGDLQYNLPDFFGAISSDPCVGDSEALCADFGPFHFFEPIQNSHDIIELASLICDGYSNSNPQQDLMTTMRMTTTAPHYHCNVVVSADLLNNREEEQVNFHTSFGLCRQADYHQQQHHHHGHSSSLPSFFPSNAWNTYLSKVGKMSPSSPLTPTTLRVAKTACLPFCSKSILEGYLYKRSEHGRSWRRRYFVLRANGTFYGYRSVPWNELTLPLNKFTVQDCQVFSLNRPKKYCFFICGLQCTNAVDCLFYVDTCEERRMWIERIQSVCNRLKLSLSQTTTTSTAAPDAATHNTVMDFELNGSFHLNSKSVKRYSLEHFEMLSLLGKGTFGTVVLCREKETSLIFAMKILHKLVLVMKDEVVHTMTENRVLQKCQHPFLTKLKYAFTTPLYLCFVMEYVNGGELYYHLRNERCFSEGRTKFYCAEIVCALGYLHTKNIVYRDLKLENLLLDKNGHIKLVDFGLCKEEMAYGASTSTFCGTPEYLAPEILLDKNYGRAVDWWALGIVMFEMVSGRLPFHSSEFVTIFQMVLMDDPPLHTLTNVSFNCCHLLHGLLLKNPRKRLGGGPEDAEEIMLHPFFEEIDREQLLRKEIQPPFHPQVNGDADTRYIPDEFKCESIEKLSAEILQSEQVLSNSDRFLVVDGQRMAEDEVRRRLHLADPHFKHFSLHGSRQSLFSHDNSAVSLSGPNEPGSGSASLVIDDYSLDIDSDTKSWERFHCDGDAFVSRRLGSTYPSSEPVDFFYEKRD